MTRPCTLVSTILEIEHSPHEKVNLMRWRDAYTALTRAAIRGHKVLYIVNTMPGETPTHVPSFGYSAHHTNGYKPVDGVDRYFCFGLVVEGELSIEDAAEIWQLTPAARLDTSSIGLPWVTPTVELQPARRVVEQS